MTSDRRDKGSHRIPIRFTDADDEFESESAPADMDRSDPDNEADEFLSDDDLVAGGEPDSDDLAGGIDVELSC